MHTRKFQTQRPMRRPSRAKGVVLVVALMMLTVLSLMVVASIKGAGSSEALSNNNRTQTQAMQAAEAALRFCEEGVRRTRQAANDAVPVPPGGIPRTVDFTIGVGIYVDIPAKPFVVEPIPSGANIGNFTWASKSNWDANPINANIYVLSNDSTGTPYLPANMYKRMPECMAQYQDALQLKVVITARGFGPEVADPGANDATRQPDGAEVWVQSYLTF
jgi:hypothetical protein